MIMSIANRLRELRLNRNMRQDQVAKTIGVTKSTMCAYENGTRQPSYDILVSLARLYHVSTDYLLGLSNERVVSLKGLSEEEINLVVELIGLLSKK